jgi:hypothetical protein
LRRTERVGGELGGAERAVVEVEKGGNDAPDALVREAGVNCVLAKTTQTLYNKKKN